MSAVSIVRHRMTEPTLSPEGAHILARIVVYLMNQSVVADAQLYTSARALLEIV
jgi:hypothetical protein